MMAWSGRLPTLLLFLTACSASVAPVEASCSASPFMSDTPLVIAHADGNTIAPSNSMLALERAVKMGADVLDLDVRMTSDSVVVARHDRELSTTTDGTGPVDAMAWADVAELDAGVTWTGDALGSPVRVPRVDDALNAFPDKWFSLEIKQTVPPMGAALCEVIDRTNSAERVFISSNDDDAAYGFNDVCPDVLLTTTYRDLDDRAAAEAAGQPWCSASPIGQPPFRAGFNAERVAESHRRGAAIFVWTVNDADDLRAVARAGVDGVYTDRPDLARQIFDNLD
jgi:glycerophosphoryl diester phosphodiesterase